MIDYWTGGELIIHLIKFYIPSVLFCVFQRQLVALRIVNPPAPPRYIHIVTTLQTYLLTLPETPFPTLAIGSH